MTNSELYYSEFYRQSLDTEPFKMNKKVDTIFKDYLVGGDKHVKKLRSNLKLYIANFILYDIVAIPEDAHHFTENKHEFNTYSISKKTLEILKDKKFIYIYNKGYKAIGFESGFATSYHSTKLFDEIFSKNQPRNVFCKYYKRKMNTEMHGLFKYSQEQQIIKDKDNISNNITNNKDSTNKLLLPLVHKNILPVGGLHPKLFIDYSHPIISGDITTFQIDIHKKLSGTTEKRLLDEMVDFNESYFYNIKLKSKGHRIYENIHLTRIYNDRDGKWWGGRLYQRNSYSYQTMPKLDRPGLKLNREATYEIDFNTMHVNLLYNFTGIESPTEDAYNKIIDNIGVNSNDKLRSAVKRVVMIAINAKSYGSFKQAFNRGKSIASLSVLKGSGLTLDMVMDSFKEMHAPISDFIYSDYGVVLQRLDSEIMMNILYRLADKDIYGIPLHDSVICQKRHGNDVAEIMKEEYKKYTGFDINVKCK